MTEMFGPPKPFKPGERTPIWQSGWFNALGRFLALVVVFLFFALIVEEGKFCSLRNLENILRQSAVYATAALGMTMIIITAGIDLSIGSIIALCVVMVAWVLNLHYEVTRAASEKPEVVYLIHEWPLALPILAVLAGVLVATLAGMLNGLTIVRLRLVPFIVTLGTMMIFRGLAKGIASDKDIYPPRAADDTWVSSLMDPVISTDMAKLSFRMLWCWAIVAAVLALWLGFLHRRAARWGPWLVVSLVGVLHLSLLHVFWIVDYVPYGGAILGVTVAWAVAAALLPGLKHRRILAIAGGAMALGVASELHFALSTGVEILVIAALLAALLLRYTRLGRHIFAVGSNPETARLCGVPVGRTKIIVYTFAGLFGGLAGLMQFSSIGAFGSPTTASTYELYVIAAVVIGGGSFMGGEGSILGSLIGALIIAILYMGGKQADWPQWVQDMVIGAIIIGAVALDQFRHRRMA